MEMIAPYCLWEFFYFLFHSSGCFLIHVLAATITERLVCNGVVENRTLFRSVGAPGESVRFGHVSVIEKKMGIHYISFAKKAKIQ